MDKDILETPTHYKHFVKRTQMNMLGFTSRREVRGKPAIAIMVTRDGIEFVRFNAPKRDSNKERWSRRHNPEEADEFTDILAECVEFHRQVEYLEAMPYIIVNNVIPNEMIVELTRLDKRFTTNDLANTPDFVGRRAGSGGVDSIGQKTYLLLRIERTRADLLYYVGINQLLDTRTGRMAVAPRLSGSPEAP